MSLYPRPVHDHFVVDCPAPSVMRIYDPLGKEVMQKSLAEGTNRINEAGLLPRGIYFVVLTSAGEISYFKLIKE